jgi:hypothetical protein
MYLEQKVEKLTAAMEAVQRNMEDVARAQLALAKRVDDAYAELKASSGLSAEMLAGLLAEVAKNLYPKAYSPAPKGSAQDDGEPTDKMELGAAQKAETDTPAPSASGGTETRAPEVVAAPAEETPPAPDEPEPEPEPEWQPIPKNIQKVREWIPPRVVVQGRTVSGPRADVFVQSAHAAIITSLLTGPKSIQELSDATFEKNNRMTAMRLGTMKMLLKDAGLEVILIHGKHTLREIR